MRFFSIVTAVVVAIALYGIVFERERLLELAGRKPVPDAPAQESASVDDPAEADAVSDDVAMPSNSGAISVVVMESRASTVDNTIALRGQTEAVRQVEVKSQSSGLVISDPLRKGAFVLAGDVLCQVEPGTRPAQLAEAEARLAEAMISDTAAARLAEGGFGSETRAAAAAASRQAADAAVDRAETEIRRLTIVAPFDGLLETDTAELGSLLRPGDNCATVLQLDPIKLVGYLPETAVNDVKTGASAYARLSSGSEVQGIVTFLSRSADQSTRTFKTEISVENTDLLIRDGQSAEIAITAEGVPAHKIPASALTLNDSGTMGVRVVDEDDIVRFNPVTILRDTTEGMIVNGLPETARVIVVGQEYVTDGVQVNVTVRSNDA